VLFRTAGFRRRPYSQGMSHARSVHAETDVLQRFNQERYNAYARLLSRPDPKGMPRRANVSRWAGESDRRGTRLPGILMAWMQRRHLALDVNESETALTS
jgi:hypothetical protein